MVLRSHHSNRTPTMASSAFILSTTPFLSGPRLRSGSFTSSARPLSLGVSPYSRRVRTTLRANAETDEKTPATDSSSASSPEERPNTTFEAPSFDTDVFSNFVDSAQSRIEDLQKQFSEVDSDELVENAKETSTGLIDNVLAGDWLNRGELYGGIQLVFVVLLLRSPGGLDGLVSFLCGPLILFAGAFISGKSLWDLGRKQLSIWPAPVPNGDLKTNGLYEYVRHPMYSGLILASAGWSVSTGSPARLALTIAFAAFLAKKISVEEEYLLETYPEYSTYCDKVTNKILPGIY